MSKEKSMILEMLSSGKISAEEAVLLITALGEEPVLDQTPLEETPAENPIEETVPTAAAEWPREKSAERERFGERRWCQVRPRFPDPSYAAAIQRFGVDFTPAQLIDLEMASVTPAEVEDLLTVRRQEWSTENLSNMLIHRVTKEMILQFHELGMGDLPAEKLVEFTIHRVTPDMVRRAREVGFKDIEPDTLVAFAIHKVDFEVVNAVLALGPLDEDEAVAMTIHGVTLSYINSMRVRFPDIRINQLIDMRIHRVSPRYMTELGELGLKDLTPSRLVEMKIHGVDPEEARRFSELLDVTIHASQLIEFAIHHVTPDYVESFMDLGLKNLSPEQLVAMRIHGVNIEAARRAKELYGEKLGADELVDMAIFGRLR